MLCLRVQMRDSCHLGGVSDGSRLAVYQNLSIECPSSIFFWHVLCVVPFSLSFCFCFVFVVMLSLELCRVPLIFSYPADHVPYSTVPDW